METARILIVDDNPEIREIIRILLQGEGYDIEEAKNGTKALEMLELQMFDLIDVYKRQAHERAGRISNRQYILIFSQNRKTFAGRVFFSVPSFHDLISGRHLILKGLKITYPEEIQ